MTIFRVSSCNFLFSPSKHVVDPDITESSPGQSPCAAAQKLSTIETPDFATFLVISPLACSLWHTPPKCSPRHKSRLETHPRWSRHRLPRWSTVLPHTGPSQRRGKDSTEGTRRWRPRSQETAYTTLGSLAGPDHVHSTTKGHVSYLGSL
jgi:hypothetical protein